MLLDPTPITGDVTFIPRLGVLAANESSWLRLSLDQQAILRDAAIAARDQAVDELVSEADAAAIWCAQGGEVVIAGSGSGGSLRRRAPAHH
jgi:hypothetical protein